MTTPQVKIVNAQTGEEIIRDMNADELEFLNQQIAEREAKEHEQAQEAAKRQALLDRLGITEDEAKLLLA